MLKLLPQINDIVLQPDTVLNSNIRNESERRVGIILVCPDGKSIIFVQPSKAGDKQTWILPQVKVGDQTLSEAFVGGVHKELGLEDGTLNISGIKVLGHVDNPGARGTNPSEKTKSIIYMIGICNTHFSFVANIENNDCVYKSNPYDLWALLNKVHEQRYEKFQIIFSALRKAAEQNVLDWSLEGIDTVLSATNKESGSFELEEVG